ncbi:MAG: hypothetical protein MHM6MM_006844 [Cercozoa sp. M6MM]
MTEGRELTLDDLRLPASDLRRFTEYWLRYFPLDTPDANGQSKELLPGSRVFKFFSSSRLKRQMLAQIWNVAVQNKKRSGGLTFVQFCSCLRLIALAQSGVPPTTQNLFKNTRVATMPLLKEEALPSRGVSPTPQSTERKSTGALTPVPTQSTSAPGSGASSPLIDFGSSRRATNTAPSSPQLVSPAPAQAEELTKLRRRVREQETQINELQTKLQATQLELRLAREQIAQLESRSKHSSPTPSTHSVQTDEQSPAADAEPTALVAPTDTNGQQAECVDSVFVMTEDAFENYANFFEVADVKGDGVVSGEEARNFFRKSRLKGRVLKKIWVIADIDQDGCLNLEEFAVAMHLIMLLRQGLIDDIPDQLPDELYPYTE